MAPPPPSPSMSSIPPLEGGVVVAGRFRVRGVLGEGGTGVVYDAVRLSDEQPVALKVMHAHLAGDRQVRARFAREATILARLSGDHVCPVLASGEVSDPRRADVSLIYMALPKIEGSPLDRVLAEGAPLSLDHAVQVMLEVCEGLRAAHAAGVVHRDLKPANVLLERGRGAVVVDFGLAKIVTGEGAGTTQVTASNVLFGTPEYMAPEQARGDELDERCDIYAAGVMLYELLTGAPPFSGGTPLATLTAQMTEPPVPPRMRTPARGISPALEAVTLHALAKSPDGRYASADALAAALRHALAAPNDVAGVHPRPGHEAPPPAPPPRTPARVDTPEPISAVRREITRADAASRRLWAVVWVVAVIAAIALGAWLSLRVGP